MAEHDLHAAAFPRLDESHMAAVGRCPLTVLKKYRDGDKLFEAGARDFKFFIVKSGTVDIVDESGETPKTIAVHGPGEFTGDAYQLTGSPSLFSGVARGECEAYEISPDALRQILNNHPDLGDVILQAFLARRQLVTQPGTYTGLRVIGSRYSRDTFRIRDFLAKNRMPFTWLDLEVDPQAEKLLRQFGLAATDTPVVAWGRKLLLRNPSNPELAQALGIRQPLEQTVYDLVVVGAGPAGLAAAVYGGSEGLNTVVLERTGPGGQAGRSMRIENYLGFPTGITGLELAERAVVQASKFGARLPAATLVTSLTFDQTYLRLHLDGGETVMTKCLLIATGADYRRMTAEGCEQFEGCGVYYAATFNEAQMCKGSDVVVVGGGNSAGQAAVFLSAQSRRVYLVIRGNDLGKDMSSYLVQRIEETPNIEVLRNTEVRRMSGDLYLRSVELVNTKTGEVKTLEVQALFSFIGAMPRTDWLPPEIEKDTKNFIRTGPALSQSPHWTAMRQPFLLETSRPGVFAAGDVRSGSVKRVASAVGEGAMAVQFVHQYLRER
ncbi:MAG TPA: FAD-dependent oxidoreductase [Nitrospira sp.]|nr:FAD-dependent oxidoreductase [Nitrospira sp.]